MLYERWKESPALEVRKTYAILALLLTAVKPCPITHLRTALDYSSLGLLCGLDKIMCRHLVYIGPSVDTVFLLQLA